MSNSDTCFYFPISYEMRRYMQGFFIESISIHLYCIPISDVTNTLPIYIHHSYISFYEQILSYGYLLILMM